MGDKTHYEVLGVDPHASQDDIKAAYKTIARENNVDAAIDAQDHARCSIIMQASNLAYEVLKDPTKKAEYDLTLVRTGSEKVVDWLRDFADGLENAFWKAVNCCKSQETPVDKAESEAKPDAPKKKDGIDLTL